MRAGKLRHLIKLQRPVTTLDDAGQEILTWKTYKTTKAEIMTAGARESWESNAVESFTSRTVRIRYTPGVTSQHRILFCRTGQIFTIRGIANWQERNRELILTTLEYRDEGTY